MTALGSSAALPAASRSVFVTGATGYLGSRLVPLLVARGHRVKALVRAESRARAPRDCEVLVGEALQRSSFAAAVGSGETLVHLVGTPRPSPAKAKQFREIDLASVREAVKVATYAHVAHFVYVSVAHPAPIMHAFVASRAAGEREIREAGLTATFLRPWYVLGPGHFWPHALRPLYALAKLFPGLRQTALRIDLVTLPQMLLALVDAVEHPPASGVRVVEAPEIRRFNG